MVGIAASAFGGKRRQRGDQHDPSGNQRCSLAVVPLRPTLEMGRLQVGFAYMRWAHPATLDCAFRNPSRTHLTNEFLQDKQFPTETKSMAIYSNLRDYKFGE